MGRWRIELFGGLRLCDDSGQVTYCRAQKPMALLALLAFRHRHAHPREALIEQFWPDDDLPTGRHKLSVTLSVLRGQLEPAGVPAGTVIAADRSSLRLVAGSFETDVDHFEEALRRAGQTGRPEERERYLSEAMELYSGELLSGFYDSWIFPEQQRLAERFLQAVDARLELYERSGDRRAQLAVALRGVSADPLSESLHARVMRIYLTAGEPAAAVRQYQILEQRLREDLDTSPGRAALELRQAAEALLRASPPDQEPVPPPPSPAPLPREPVGGAVPLGSPYYVERRADPELHAAIARRDCIVLLKGPRQVGKTSLLARGLDGARRAGARAVLTDFQGFNAEHLETAESLLLAVAEGLADELDLPEGPREHWEPQRGPNPNFRRYFRRVVLPAGSTPLVWGLDEADRLFSRPFAAEIFGMFRSWHNERALNPAGPWASLTLAITYATEAHLFITDVNQSPFNVGTRIALDDFTLPQVADLNRRYGSPLRDEGELERFYRLVGGHPFLVRGGLQELADSGRARLTLEQLEDRSEVDEGIFDSHLRRMLLLLGRDPELCEALREVLRGRPCPTAEQFYRLRSAGVVTGDAAQAAQPRCRLYGEYFSRRLL